MKSKLILQYAILIFLFFLLAFRCKKKDVENPPPAPTPTVSNNLLDGAVFYNGSTAALGLVSYMEGTQLVSDSAYQGEVIVFFNTPISLENATTIISGKGGSVLGTIPNAGYYFVGVPVGSEGSFIDAIKTNSAVYIAQPNMPVGYNTSTNYSIDGCSITHGNQVISIQNACGGGILCMDADDGTGKANLRKIPEYLYQAVKETNSGNTLINISIGGGYIKTWRMFLVSVALMPEYYRKNLVITLSAGNENILLTSVLAEIRTDAKLKEILTNNIHIAGASDSVYHMSNDAPEDPDYANMTNVTAPNGWQGTSFGAPYAKCIIHTIINQKGLSVKDALKAVKLAAEFNAKHELKEAEAEGMADAIISGKEIWRGNYTLTTNPGSYCSNITSIYNSGRMTMLISTISGNTTGNISLSHINGWDDELGNSICTITSLPSHSGSFTGFMYGTTFSGQLMLGINQGINDLYFDGTLSGNAVTGTLSSGGSGTFTVTKE